jgi:excisionase family DNA binding protein
MRRKASDQYTEPRFLTTRQAAARLGVTINAIKAWIREEQLAALRTPGGHHRIAEADLIAFQARLTENSRQRQAPKPRILVADDDEFLLPVLRETIEQILPDAQVAVATDGYEALVQVGAFRPDVLVLDIRMPRLDGFEVCRRLKARKETAAIRILAVSSYPEEEVRGRILECGADEFLGKPFPLERFRSRVVALLEARARE